MKHERSYGTGIGMFVGLAAVAIAFAVLVAVFGTPEALVGDVLGSVFGLYLIWASKDVPTLEDRYGERAALREAAQVVAAPPPRREEEPRGVLRPRHP